MLDLIRDGTRTGVYVNATDFRREFRISRRTAMRDLDVLRDDHSAPVEYDPSRKGYYMSDKAWHLPPVRLSRREVFSFAIARKLLQSFRGTPLEGDMRAVLEKVAESMEGSITLDVGALTEHMTVLGEDYVVQDPAIWEAVAGCVDRRERMRAVYQKFDGTVGTYELDPYHLLAYHGDWYVLARHVRKGQVATFAVSRIRRVRGTNAFFAVPPDFDVSAHIRQSFGIVRGDKPFRVRLRFSRNVAAYIRARVWHPTQRIVDKRDGSLELSFETAGWKELVRWVLSWQPDCRVLAPKRLRERVKEKMRAALRGGLGR
ncbi:MAG: WYL domain-containing protein [Kiritimatiellae bacterium]|nr:WYL domain-containing protein [Kiritimatiellia bacterium]